MRKALVVLSGGQDSTTCAVIARNQFDSVFGITFNYGQRHLTEVQSAIKISQKLDISLEILDLGDSILKGTSPLISNSKLGQYESADELPTGVEPTFVPARNILFLTLAANRAAVLGINDLFTGVCQADFAGYWDCRQVFIDKLQDALNEGIYGEDRLKIHTPLMDLTKSESVKLAYNILGEQRFNDIFELTHTCYAGVKGGCGKCHACVLRDKGFNESGIVDPIWKY
ncbi:MAG: 7-cyano-7-deazaguanine synthase QueC, partial [Dolichospermum sp.]